MLISSIKNILKRSILRFVRLLPIKRDLILFESFLGRGFSDNPKAIYSYIRKHHPDMRCVWIFNEPPTEQLEWVKRGSFRYHCLMARAGYWVFNTRQPKNVIKRSGTVYLQTWHGTPLKRLGLDMEEVFIGGQDSETYKNTFVRQAAEWDYLISPNRYSSEIFRRAFGFSGEMLEIGYPRNDLFFKTSPDVIHGIRTYLGIPHKKKVILYAPTWRDDAYIVPGKYRFDLELDLRELKNRVGEDYVVLLRMHYLVAENLDLSGLEDFAYDVSKYSDIAELYLISDILITDYSSVFFDFAQLRRPILFFTYDLTRYRDELRGFYLDFEHEVPGPLLMTTSEIADAIEKIEDVSSHYAERYDAFHERFCSLDDGEASARAVRALLKGE